MQVIPNVHWFRSALLVLTARSYLPVYCGQRTAAGNVLISKLDAPLSASVRAHHSDTKRVIIRATSDGDSRLTNALKASGHGVRRVHSTINAITANVPVAALEGLSQLPFVESISSDEIVRANPDVSGGFDAQRNARSACQHTWRVSGRRCRHRFRSGAGTRVRRPPGQLLRLHSGGHRSATTITATALTSLDSSRAMVTSPASATGEWRLGRGSSH